MNQKALFSRFLSAAPRRLHLAAHSHHYWPDVTLEAQQTAWLDAALLADEKWERVFGQVLPSCQQHVARILNLPDPASIAFGPNTHEFLVRILSSFDPRRPHKILTTDGEFHSAARQFARLEEEGLAEITRVSTRPFDTFEARFREAAAEGGFDLAYVSHVFFDSGFAVRDLSAIAGAVRDEATVIVIDGYHGFCALPTDLSPIASRVFYVSGGYKYAMAGEGCCFVHAPDCWVMRPRATGWMASFGALAQAQAGAVPYASGGARMMGATFDPSGLYRLNAAMDLLVRESIDIGAIHAHVHALHARFVDGLGRHPEHPLKPEALVVPIRETSRGHFLTYELPNAAEVQARLLDAQIVTDVRGNRLRFGFALYHDSDDADEAAERVAAALA